MDERERQGGGEAVKDGLGLLVYGLWFGEIIEKNIIGNEFSFKK